MTTRNGKVARLPFEIREELNHRLLENEPAKNIVNWLGSHPTARLFMEQLFEGRPINENNISEWRQGGYQEWLAYRSYLGGIQDLSENAARVALTGLNAQHLLLVLTASYADLLQKWDATPEIAFNRRLIVLQHLTTTALAMRRSEQRDARLKLDEERVEILRQRDRDKSPSSGSSSRASSFSARAPAAHPDHPKAPEIRRPPVADVAHAAEARPDDADCPSPRRSTYPDASGPYPQSPTASPVVPATPAGRGQPPICSGEPDPAPVSPSRQSSSNDIPPVQTPQNQSE